MGNESLKNKGKYYSWEIINDKVCIKNTDKSVFLNNGSTIPIGVRSFFDIETMSPASRIPIILIYHDVEHEAHIERESEKLNNRIKNLRTRIFWKSSLKKEFSKINWSTNNFPMLRFERIAKNRYEISFIENISCDNFNKNITTMITSAKEGKKIVYYTSKYERSFKNRINAIKIHGTKCMACGFDFEKNYGPRGTGFIEVHHKVPLNSIDDIIEINPETDLVCLCANCHRIIHRKKSETLSFESLVSLIEKYKSNTDD